MRGFNFGPAAGTTTYGGARGIVSGSGMRPMGAYGDPGFFDFLGGVVKKGLGVVSGLGIPFVSGAAGVARGLLGGGRGPGMSGVQRIDPIMLASRMGQQGLPTTEPRRGGRAFLERAVRGGETGMGAGCTQGYRPNKSGYWLNSGEYVEPGSTCVKSRRMNPLNPKALSRAARRIEGAKRAQGLINRITIRKKC